MPIKKCVVCSTEFKARLSAYQACGTVCRNRLIAAEKEKKHTTEAPCAACGRLFAKAGKRKHVKTCSRECSHVLTARAREVKEDRECRTCGKHFQAIPSNKTPYCSRECGYGRNKTDRECEVCGSLFRTPPSQMHVRSCSDACGYKLRADSNSKDKVVIKCACCGELFDEHVSHAERRRFCSNRCQFRDELYKAEMSERVAGDKNPGWQGGITRLSESSSGRTYHRMSAEKEAAKLAKRRAAKLRATPEWADPVLILAFYKECKRRTEETGIVHHVDHIVPLVSKDVCGLHCEHNLQVLTWLDNIRKHNRTWPDKP